MTLGMLVQIGLIWIGLSMLGGVLWVVLCREWDRAYEDGWEDGYFFAMGDRIPHVAIERLEEQ